MTRNLRRAAVGTPGFGCGNGDASNRSANSKLTPSVRLGAMRRAFSNDTFAMLSTPTQSNINHLLVRRETGKE